MEAVNVQSEMDSWLGLYLPSVKKLASASTRTEMNMFYEQLRNLMLASIFVDR